MNREVYGRQMSWPNVEYYPGIFLEELKKITKPLNQYSRSLGRDLNRGPPKYGSGQLTTQSLRSQVFKGDVSDDHAT
jgi:hypothetical protein